MKINKEGYNIILVSFLILGALNAIAYYFLADIKALYISFSSLSAILYFLIVFFFRHPKREVIINDNHILAPADGKVVVIEEVIENEYFNDKRIQISIFMSPLNVHVNWYPISGLVKYFKHHHGAYMVAWHPKSSTENERTTTVIEKSDKDIILVKQIAGAVARRIVSYAKTDTIIKQGDQLGFIKFGSRLDVLIPLDTKINVELNQKVVGNKTVIAEFR